MLDLTLLVNQNLAVSKHNPSASVSESAYPGNSLQSFSNTGKLLGNDQKHRIVLATVVDSTHSKGIQGNKELVRGSVELSKGLRFNILVNHDQVRDL